MGKTTAHLPGIRDDPPSSPDTDAEYALKTAQPIRLWRTKKAHAAWEDPAALQAGGRWFEPGTAHQLRSVLGGTAVSRPAR